MAVRLHRLPGIHFRRRPGLHDNVRVSLAFSDYDRQRIFNYYGHPRKHHKPIPPGYYKRYQKHRPLPGRYASRPLPYELNRHLTRLPRDYAYVLIGNDIAIMNLRTRVLFDILWFVR
jgi:hypothetical protein